MRKNVSLSATIGLGLLAWIVATPNTVAQNAAPAVSSSVQKAPVKTVIVDGFESYTSDELLARAWYKPPHGAPIHQTRETAVKNGGQYSMKVEYHTIKSDDKFYAPICRVSKWNLGGCNALQFWLKPDGSGRALLIDLNISNREGKNIHDLWDYTKPTQWDRFPSPDFRP